MSATIRIPKRSKFNVRTDAAGKLARTYDGVVYDSAAEARYAAQLDLRLKAGDIDGWERQRTKPLVVSGVKIGSIKIDFVVIPNGPTPTEYHEVKGFDTAVGKLKRKLFEAIYGHKITVIPAKDVR